MRIDLRQRLTPSIAIAPIAVVLLCLGTLACGGPFVLLPGGELAGQVEHVPAEWSVLDDISTVQIETNPEDPYSVNIWAAAVGSSLYLHAGGNRTTWVEHLEVNPNIRVRIDDKIYEMIGSRVSGEDEYATFSDAYEIKYGIRPRNENIDEIYVIRLEAR
jgi:hypothetical protein